MVRVKTPREHGFWVMLFIALAVGVGAAPGWLALLSAACLALFSTGLAMWLGRRIRRNAWLQVLSGPSLATLAVPIGVIGGASLEKMLNLYLPVALVFLSTTLAVQAILYRAQRKQSATQRAEYAALSVSFVAVLISLVWRPAGTIAAMVLCATFVTALHFLKPTARRLKHIGISVAIVQLGVACLLFL